MMLFEPSPTINSRIEERFVDMQPHLRPLWAAVMKGCTFAIVAQGDGVFRIPTKRPALVVVGDDLASARGPAAFNRQSLRRYLSRCSAVCIVSSAAVPDAYAAMAAEAVDRRRDAAIIETQPRHEGEWLALVQQSAPLAKVLLCRPLPSTGLH